MHVLQLSLTLAKADFKLRNEGSYLGILWYLLAPLATFAILFVVFSGTIGAGISHYPVYLLLGLIVFNMFRQITVESTRVIYNNRILIKSVPFEIRALVLAIVLRNLFSHFFEIIIFFIIALFFGISVIGILAYPFLLFVFLIFIYGVSLFLSALSVYFLDLENIWSVFTQALWFATPIFYTIGDQHALFLFNQANPMYYFITLARNLIINGTIGDMNILIGVIIYSASAFLLGEIAFHKVEKIIAERF